MTFNCDPTHLDFTFITVVVIGNRKKIIFDSSRKIIQIHYLDGYNLNMTTFRNEMLQEQNAEFNEMIQIQLGEIESVYNDAQITSET